MKYTVKNPVLSGFHPDPCIIFADGTYYMATSTFEYYPGVKISASEDLANWRTVSYPLNTLKLLDMRGDAASTGIWAPALSYADGMFWLIFTNQKQWCDEHLKDTENYLTTCKTIDGQWSDPVYLNSSGFDPSLFHDTDGKKYLLNMNWDYRNDTDGERFAGIYIQEYDHAAKSLSGKPRKLFSGTDRHITEGPHMFKRNGYYYLLTAEGGTGLTHCATLARSREIFGEYELHPQKHIITSFGTDCYLQKAGHASLCEGKDGEWIMAHLCARPLQNGRCMLGRETALQNVEWRQDDWVYLSNNTQHPSDTFSAFAARKEQTEYYYDFSEEKLSDDFMTLRQPIDPKVFDLAQRKGYLRIRGRKSLVSLFDQSVLLRRQESFQFSAKTCVDFNPEHFNHWAGLLYRYSEANQHCLYISFDPEKGERELLKITYDDGKFALERIAFLPKEGEIYLQITVKSAVGQFSYSVDGSAFMTAGKSFDASKLSDEYNRPLAFTGPFVGICCLDMSDLKKTADFKFFSYSGE